MTELVRGAVLQGRKLDGACAWSPVCPGHATPPWHQEPHACWSAASNTLPSPEDCCMCGDSTLSCMVICAFFFFPDWHLEGSDKHFVSYCCRKQWLFVCHSSACFSLYLCTNPADTSVFPRLLIIIHICRFQQEKETNHVVRDVCGENGEKAKIWTAEVDPSGAIWKYSSRASGPNSDVSYKSKIQAQWHGASSPGIFDLSSLRWTDYVLVPNSVFQTYGTAIATFCQTVVDSVAEIQVFYCLLLKTTSVLQFE